MAHLKTFSRLHHCRFGEYRKGTLSGQPVIINDNGNDRQLEIDDLYNPDYNYLFSDNVTLTPVNDVELLVGRRISFQPLEYNTSGEFNENIGKYIDHSGIAIQPKVFDSFQYQTNGGPSWNFYNISDDHEFENPQRLNLYNFDNYNPFLRWTAVLLSPRHVMMCSHCYVSFCTLSENDYNGAKTVNINLTFMGKNNQIYKPFPNQESLISAVDSGTLRMKRCDTPFSNATCSCGNTSYTIIELPNDTWIDKNQVKYYDKVFVRNAIPHGYPVFSFLGAGNTIRPEFFSPLLRRFFYTEGINQVGSVPNWTGDSAGPRLANYNGETCLVDLDNEFFSFTENLINEINEFMKNSGHQITPIYISYEDLPSNFLGETETYFSTINDSILSNSPYGSRFSKNERENFKSINIGFIPGNQLQASELNELQDLFHKQITLSNKIISEMIIDNIKSDTVLFKNVSQTNDPVLLIKRNTYDSLFLDDGGIVTTIGSGVFPLKPDSNLLFYEKFNNLEFKFRGDPRAYSVYLNYSSNKQKPDLSDELTYFLSDSAHRIYYQKEIIGGFDFETFAFNFVFNDEYSYDGHLFEQP